MNNYTYKIYAASVEFWKARGVLLFAGDSVAKLSVWSYCCRLRKARCLTPSPRPSGRGHLMVELHPDDYEDAAKFAKQQEIAQLKRERAARLVDKSVK